MEALKGLNARDLDVGEVMDLSLKVTNEEDVLAFLDWAVVSPVKTALDGRLTVITAIGMAYQMGLVGPEFATVMPLFRTVGEKLIEEKRLEDAKLIAESLA